MGAEGAPLGGALPDQASAAHGVRYRVAEGPLSRRMHSAGRACSGLLNLLPDRLFSRTPARYIFKLWAHAAIRPVGICFVFPALGHAAFAAEVNSLLHIV